MDRHEAQIQEAKAALLEVQNSGSREAAVRLHKLSEEILLGLAEPSQDRPVPVFHLDEETGS